jgi:hypothetical protein
MQASARRLYRRCHALRWTPLIETDSDRALEARPCDSDAEGGGTDRALDECLKCSTGVPDLAARWAGVEIDLGASMARQPDQRL